MAVNQPLGIGAMLATLRSHAMATKAFGATMTREPVKPPGQGHTWAGWLSSLDPVPRASGLAVTSLRVEFQLRQYTPYNAPSNAAADVIDDEIAARTDLLFAAYSGDFEITPRNHTIDLLGAYGEALRSRMGWLTFPPNTQFRIMDIFVPVILFNVYDQES
jgi:hypothetical protein